MEALTAHPAVAIGLTTTQAPFIEEARQQGQLYIQQPYELYSAENHEAWRRLYAVWKSPGTSMPTLIFSRASIVSASIPSRFRAWKTSIGFSAR